LKKKAVDVDDMDGENEQESTEEPNYFHEEEKLFKMDEDLKDPFDELIKEYGNDEPKNKKKLGTDDPFDPQNWGF